MTASCSSRRIAAALGLALGLISGTTRAGAGAAFSWQAPPQCPTRDEVLERFSEVVGHRDAERAESVLGAAHVRGRIELDAARWSLLLEVEDERGRRERRLTAEHCEALAQAAALSLALLLEQELEREAQTRAAPSVTPDSAEASSGQDPGPAPVLPAAPAREVTLAASAYGLLDTSTLAAPALGFGGAVSARLAAWSLGAHAIWLPSQRAELSGAAQAIELEHWSVGLRPCRALLGQVWTLEACAAIDIGRLHAQGINLEEARAMGNRWLAVGAGVGLRWNRPGGALHARAELLCPLERKRYIVNEAQLVHQTPPETLRLLLGFDLTL